MFLTGTNEFDLNQSKLRSLTDNTHLLLFPLFFFHMQSFFSSVHSHSYLRYTNDCMIAIAAQLWNQGDPRVLDATVLSLTTNELCASLTVLIGICLAVTEPARH